MLLIFRCCLISGLLVACTNRDCFQAELLSENGNKIAYQTCGTGEKLVFIHAGGLDRDLWGPQVEHFSSQYEVMTYDIRGHGSSSFVDNEGLDIHDLHSILDEEGFGKVNLVGCSLGSIIALDFILTFPERVNRLVLVSPGLIGFQEQDSLFLSQMMSYGQAFMNSDTVGMIQQLKYLNALGNLDQLPQELDRYVTTALNSFVRSPGLTRIPQLSNLQPLSSLDQVEQPSIVIYGENDHAYIIRNAKRLNQALPNSELQKIENSAHLPALQQPTLFNQLLSDFLTSN